MVELAPDSETALTTTTESGDAAHLPVSWGGLPDAVSEGDTVFLADGRIRLRVLESGNGEVRCDVEAGGPVASHQGLNLPGAEVSLPSAGSADLEWVDFAIEQGIDLLAISFVRRAEDILPVERRIRTSGSDIPVIAKIEKPQAAERSEEIVKATTAGIMVARGDLGIELPIEQVPTVQRALLRLAGKHARPSITATQMLASMVSSPRPTRAEVSDVTRGDPAGHRRGDALRGDRRRRPPRRGGGGDGPDRPRHRARPPLRQLALQPSPDRQLRRRRLGRPRRGRLDLHARPGGDRRARREAAAPPAWSRPTGRGCRSSPSRPASETVRRLQVLFGVRCELAEDWEGLTALLGDCARLARESGVASSGDLIGITAGMPEQELGTNLFEIHRVP